MQMAIEQGYCLNVPLSHKDIKKSLIKCHTLVHPALHARLDLFKNPESLHRTFASGSLWALGTFILLNPQ